MSPEKRGTPSAKLLATVKERTKIPRKCVVCGKNWINTPSTYAGKLCCNPSERKWIWRQGVDLKEFQPERIGVEEFERQFERDLAEHKAKLRAGAI